MPAEEPKPDLRPHVTSDMRHNAAKAHRICLEKSPSPVRGPHVTSDMRDIAATAHWICLQKSPRPVRGQHVTENMRDIAAAALWICLLRSPVVKALSNGKVGPRQRTLPTYLPKVDVPRPPPPPLRWRPTSQRQVGGGDLRPRRTSQRQWQRPTSTWSGHVPPTTRTRTHLTQRVSSRPAPPWDEPLWALRRAAGVPPPSSSGPLRMGSLSVHAQCTE